MGQWGEVFWKGGEKFGRTFRIVEDDIQRKGIAKAGFEHLVVKEWKGPFGAWSKEEKWKEIGFFSKMVADSDMEGERPFAQGYISV